MKCLILDTYYPEFLKTWKIEQLTYAEALRSLLNYCFGTFDAYSRHLTSLGWECRDVIANYDPLQAMWVRENGKKATPSREVVFNQIDEFDPDVIFCQDLSYFTAAELDVLGRRHMLAGQCSCPLPTKDRAGMFDVIFSSLQQHVLKFKSIGVTSVYLPLAYDHYIGAHNYSGSRPDDCVFVGGVGIPSHWASGMNTLEAVAIGIPSADFYGYGYKLLSPSSPIRRAWRGSAFGAQMYDVLRRSLICLNRHGEIAGDCANNLRMFEATGSGSLLLTDNKSNIREFFAEDECATYNSPEDAVNKVRYYLEHRDEAMKIAARGRARTLKDHTYANRMPIVSEVLKGLIHDA